MKSNLIRFFSLSLMVTTSACASVPENLPKPDSGIQIVSMSEMYGSQTTKAKSLGRIKQQQTKGYVQENEPYAKYLLTIKNHALVEIQQNKTNAEPTDTHLKASINEISLAFATKSLASVNPKNVIGFAAVGSWHDGWTGVKEFFESHDLGICEYSKINRILSHGGVQIAAEIARFDINDKPNFLKVKGTENTGYLYTIKWYDDTFNHSLECANSNYSIKITSNLITYAKLIAKDKG
jgi:hypothetical protein